MPAYVTTYASICGAHAFGEPGYLPRGICAGMCALHAFGDVCTPSMPPLSESGDQCVIVASSQAGEAIVVGQATPLTCPDTHIHVVCDTKLGWMYEFATEDNQRYKEGRIILERALIIESDGFEERGVGTDN